MAVDPAIIDLTARMDHLLKRIERLETLEFGTAAFPTGGGVPSSATSNWSHPPRW